MDPKTMLDLTFPLALGLAAFGCALGLGRSVSAAMEAIGRQPEAFMKILIAMTVGAAFIEALTIYVFVFAWMKV